MTGAIVIYCGNPASFDEAQRKNSCSLKQHKSDAIQGAIAALKAYVQAQFLLYGASPMTLMAKIAGMAVLPLAALTIFGQAASADTLTTQDFEVQIQSRCAEGSVTCNNVSYTGINLHTGATLRLTGRTLHSLCADGVTPCRFLGYQFRNGAFTYTVTEEGQLIVSQGRRTLLNQAGIWQRD